MTEDPFDIPPLERNAKIAREERVSKMIPRKEPSDKPDRDEIEKLAERLWHAIGENLTMAFDADLQHYKYPRPGLQYSQVAEATGKELIAMAEMLAKDYVPRFEHERIVGELKKEHRKECLSLMNPVGRLR